MECTVCGKFYSVAHDCAGLTAQSLSEREAAPIPTGLAPLYYLQLAISIMRWDDVSIRRASRDPRSLLYGAFLWIIAAALIVARTVVPVITKTINQGELSGATALIAGLIAGLIAMVAALLIVGVVTVGQWGLCHLIAKVLFKAKGTFVGILRPLSLGWPINLLSLIPVIGPILAGLLWAAVMMVVFEEINHIRRLQAFAVSYGVNMLFLAASAILTGLLR